MGEAMIYFVVAILIASLAFYSVVDDDGSYGRGVEVTIFGRVFRATIPIFSDHGGCALAFDVRCPLWSRKRRMWYYAKE